METRIQRILIIKPSSLGDVVHALGVLGPLKRAFKGARISWLIRPEFAPLLECVSGVDEIVLFDRRLIGKWWYSPAGFAELMRFVGKLGAGKYDLVLDLQGLLRSGLFAGLTGCRQRLGVSDAREGARWFYTQRLEPLGGDANIFEYYRQLLGAAGVSVERPEVELRIGAEAQERTESLLKQEGLAGRKFAVLVPGSAHERKCWPGERFARAAEYLAGEKGLAVAAVGTKKESEAVEAIRGASAAGIVNLAGKTDLAVLLGVFERAAIVVGNDTGPTHMAAGIGRPVVVVFGDTNPARLYPYGNKEAAAAIEPWGRGGGIKSEDPKYRIEHVTVEMVIECIEAQLRRVK